MLSQFRVLAWQQKAIINELILHMLQTVILEIIRFLIYQLIGDHRELS